jgi:hypothetical protein
VRWNRYQQAKLNALPKYDFKPKNFAFVMRWEILIIFGSICMGMMLPSILRKSYDYNPNYTRNQPQQF